MLRFIHILPTLVNSNRVKSANPGTGYWNSEMLNDIFCCFLLYAQIPRKHWKTRRGSSGNRSIDRCGALFYASRCEGRPACSTLGLLRGRKKSGWSCRRLTKMLVTGHCVFQAEKDTIDESKTCNIAHYFSESVLSFLVVIDLAESFLVEDKFCNLGGML